MSNYKVWLSSRDEVIVSHDITFQEENVCGSHPKAVEVDTILDGVTVPATVDKPVYVNREEQP